MSEILRVLDRRWRIACKSLFGEEIGELSDYSGWLEGMIDRNIRKKSALSGKEVTIAVKEYAARARRTHENKRKAAARDLI